MCYKKLHCAAEFASYHVLKRVHILETAVLNQWFMANSVFHDHVKTKMEGVIHFASVASNNRN